METVDEEFLKAALDFMDRSVKEKKPFFTWFNSTRMHIFTHLRPESQGKTGLGIVADGMVEHDNQVARLLAKLDELGIAKDTIVVYTTDNGAEVMSWPDGGTTPFRGEKNTNWEGGYRVPAIVRWPGTVKPGTEINGVFSAEDWVPTLLAAAGQPDVVQKVAKGMRAGDKTFKAHLDGYDQQKLLAGEGPGNRHEFLYWTDDGNFAGLRYDQWKMVFLEQRAHGLNVWQDPLVALRFPKLFSLRSDPFERAEEGIGYEQWRLERAYLLIPAAAIVGQWVQSFREYPPRQRPGSFSVDQVMEKLQKRE
jgi:arylsulfatase